MNQDSDNNIKVVHIDNEEEFVDNPPIPPDLTDCEGPDIEMLDQSKQLDLAII